MSTQEVIANNENLHKITLAEKEEIDQYVETVKRAVNNINKLINSMAASGETIDKIKGILQEDTKQINQDLKKLENLSEQLKAKADGYKKYLDMLRLAMK